MGRRSSITTHPERDRIIADIAAGVPGVEIARRYAGVSESAISRWRKLRKEAVRDDVDAHAIAPAEVVVRLLDLADDSRKARQVAAFSGTPSQRSRAQQVELSIIQTLIDKLGVTSTTVADIARAMVKLAQVLDTYIRTRGNEAMELLDLMRKEEELTELAAVLADRIRR